MANRRQLLLSQLKNNLDIVSKAIGIDRDKSKASDHHQFPDDAAQRTLDVDMRFDGQQNFDQYHTYRTAHYPDTYSTDGGTYGQSGEREFYNDQFDAASERARSNESHGRANAKTFRSPPPEIESKEAFMYASDKPDDTRSCDYGYSGSGGSQNLGDRDSNLFYQDRSASAKSQSYEDAYVKAKIKIEPGVPPPSSSRASEEALEKIFKTIGLDRKVSSLVTELLKKDSLPNQNRPPSTGAFVPDSQPSDADIPGQETREKDWDTQHFLRETENFLNRIAPKTLPNDSQVPFASRYTPPPSRYTPPPSRYSPPPSRYTPPPSRYTPPAGSAQHHLPLREEERPYGSRYSPVDPRISESEHSFSTQRVDEYLVNRDLGNTPTNGRDTIEARLHYKSNSDPTASANDSHYADSMGMALDETVSNIRVLENALVSLTQTKTGIMLRPPGSQRDSLLLENLRMQEEISGQIDMLQDTANELSQRMKVMMANSSAGYQPNIFASPNQRSPLSSTSRSPERRSRESGEKSSRRTRRHSPGRRSRTRSRDRRRYSRSRSHERRRSRGRRRSRERRWSRERDSSESDHKTLDFGAAARAKVAAERAEDKEKQALELALSMYLAASEYYNGTNVWCQKCGVVFGDVYRIFAQTARTGG